MIPVCNRLLALLSLSILLSINPCNAQSTDLNWVKEIQNAAWKPRDSQGEMVYNNKMWILGGWFNSQSAPPRDVWSSEDGKDWKLVTEKAPWIHSDLPMSIAFKNKMWMMGGWYNGRLEGHSSSNAVWSSKDGSNWEEVGKAQWSPRIAAALVEFKGKMWILGGIENYYFGTKESAKNDVWYSSDGKKWVQATASAPWAARAYHHAAVLNGRIYIMGGGNYLPASEYKARNDVWSSEDGVNWRQETESAPWLGRIWGTSVVYKDRIFIMGGFRSEPKWQNLGDVWYSRDGAEWHEIKTEVSWEPRHEHSSYVFKDKLWVAGGNKWPLLNDVWSLDLKGLSFVSLPVKQEAVGKTYTYQAKADFNKSGKPVNYRLLASPTWLKVDAATGILSGTPTQSGDYSVSLEAFDKKGEKAVQQFVIQVK